MKQILLYAFLAIPLIGAFSMFALGISVIYRASRVLNLSHGAMAMLPAYAYYSLSEAGLPLIVSLPLSVAIGAILGVLVEFVFVRRLRPQGPTAQTVGTVAVTGLLIALAAKVWGTTPLLPPGVFPEGQVDVAGAAVRYGDIGLFFVGIIVSGALFAFFKFTEVGLAMRGAAQNRRGAALMGIDPDKTAAAAWALGGGLAGLAGILLASVTSLDPYNLSLQVLPAFVAALIGGLESLPGALGGAAIAGLSFGLVPALAKLPGIGSVLRYSGATQLVLTILALIVMAVKGRKFAGAEATESGLAGGSLASKPLKIGPGLLVLLLGLVIWPFFVPFSVLGTSLLAVELALVAISLVVLIGWVGQISLAQASFVGIGALVTGMFTRGLGLGFPLNAIAGAIVAGLAAAALGVVALRVRGLYLAVSTLIFAWMADQFLFPSPWLGSGTGSSTVPDQILGTPGAFISFDFTNRKTLYFVFVAILALVAVLLANLRDTKTGRAFFAVRGSEIAASSLGIDITKYKLMAFAVSGLIAGLGGSLLMIEQRTVVPAQFLFTISLQYLAIVVVGGLGSISGAISAGILFAALNELFFRVRVLSGWLEVVSAALLAVVLLVQPGGLAAAAAQSEKLRLFIARYTAPLRKLLEPLTSGLAEKWRRTRSGVYSRPPAGDWFAMASAPAPDEEVAAPKEEPPAKEEAEESAGLKLGAFTPVLKEMAPDRNDRTAFLEAAGITVRFGGLTAVSDASLVVREGEIVGLIGPNGAGKTTLFNAILGLNSPAAGTVSLHGRDATSLSPDLRARLGVARTFQVLQLFRELTVFDNLLVATHMHNASGIFSNLTVARKTIVAETEARQRVREIMSLLKLEDVATETARNLPFGTLRMVELGRALVTGARLLLLDEIASGLNEAETDRLADVIRSVRSLGVSVLLIEHDIRMVTSVSDYVYVLNQGQIIADGTSEEIQHNTEVIAAYLGEPATPTSAQPEPGVVEAHA
ncbi:MAG TPA: branched-chain amino acid ABC transporter permease/ATP-binding protein [Actinomycetota bacterium]|nr:branched-chain amino acid ABC transporter permease/ATP-binding protein [Actinomycetota bacterium]